PGRKKAKLVSLELRNWLVGRIVEVARVKHGISEKIVGTGVKPVAAAPRDNQDLRPSVAAELGVVIGGLHLELLDERERRADYDAVDEPVIVVSSIKQEAISRLARAAEMKSAGALGREFGAGCGRGAAGREQP